MWTKYLCASSIAEALKYLDEYANRARIIAGATDLMLEMERGIHPGVEAVIDLHLIPGLDVIKLSPDGIIHLGPLVTHNQCVASTLIREKAYPLARACWEVGAPQIRNRGTVAGNLVTASPANDTITALMALQASLVLQSKDQKRTIKLKDFYTGVRKTVLQPGELVVDIFFPELALDQAGTFLKLALRRAQAISLVNVAMVLTMDATKVKSAAITLGAVAPTIIHASEAEDFLVGRELVEEVLVETARLTSAAARPIDDLRASAAYRREMVRVLTLRGLRQLSEGAASPGMPPKPVLLWGKEDNGSPSTSGHGYQPGDAIRTRINGKAYTFDNGQHKSLLRLLREEAGLIGTKEGCAEGECGACTVFLDGKAVMACLVPGPRAHGAEIVTVEGLSQGEAEQDLHPLQQAFIDQGAVQCGYCSPGFLMSGAKLLEERPQPTRNEIQQALTGNLCRCTGYYKIIRAVEQASQKMLE